MAHILYDGSGKGQAQRIRVLGYRFERGGSPVYVPDDKIINVKGKPVSVAKLILAKPGFKPMPAPKPKTASASKVKEANNG